ncbi:GFA family protein [Conexibacter sp. CPCC 206217]|uniref:GFA family protein n=1 Tax=Conexibacter sp. CPCC 206217 TaxID=3064574 RepID=UPI00272571EF|nr:GFA family protein [Conexibacter sp. CPCC 206217]MDO8213808.1 GFA family protein [Conexibacter sp. CPCC 206217]
MSEVGGDDDMAMTGGCNCGAVRFAVTAPFESAGYCHCRRCQRRTGTGSSIGGTVASSAFAIVQGAEHVRTWRPEDGWAKSFCGACGSHLFSGGVDGDALVGVRLGALDGDPGIRPQWRQWVGSALPWEPIPDDGLPRYEGRRTD